MKIYSIVWLSTIVLFFNTGCNDKPTESKLENTQALIVDSVLPPRDEDDISVIPKLINGAIVVGEFNDCFGRLAIDGKTSLDTIIDVLKKKHLDAMAAIAERNAIKNNDSSYITCLKISFGLDGSNKKIKLLYQPVFAKKEYDENVIGETLRNYGINDSIGYYIYDSVNGFTPATNLTALDRYKIHMQFKHPYNNTFTVFNPVDDASGDVTAVIFPFQEIDSIVSWAKNVPYVKLYNTAIRYPFPKSKVYIKHSVLLSPSKTNDRKTLLSDGTNTTGGGYKTRKLANLAHLCPPHCIRVAYILE